MFTRLVVRLALCALFVLGVSTFLWGGAPSPYPLPLRQRERVG